MSVGKYQIKYGIGIIVFIFIVPAILYVLLSRGNLIGTRILVPSLSLWCGLVIATWVLGLLCILISDQWNDQIEQSCRDRGISQEHMAHIIWSFTVLPAVFSAALTLLTLLNKPPLGQEFLIERFLAIFMGFVPLCLYGFFKASQVTRHLLHGTTLMSMKQLSQYLRSKWHYVSLIGLTLILTPFFGAIGLRDLGRYVPKSRKFIPFYFILGFIITFIIARNLGDQMRGAFPEGWALYFSIALFTGVAYVFIWKSVLLSNWALSDKRDATL